MASSFGVHVSKCGESSCLFQQGDTINIRKWPLPVANTTRVGLQCSLCGQNTRVLRNIIRSEAQRHRNRDHKRFTAHFD